MQKHYSSHSLLSWCKVVISHIAYVPKSACTCCADDLDDVADSVLPGGKDTVSICLITGFESFNISLYTKVHCIQSLAPSQSTSNYCISFSLSMTSFNMYVRQITFLSNQFFKDEGHAWACWTI